MNSAYGSPAAGIHAIRADLYGVARTRSEFNFHQSPINNSSCPLINKILVASNTKLGGKPAESWVMREWGRKAISVMRITFSLVSQIFQLIASLRGKGMAILLSGQNARLSLAIADRGYVIENGRVALSGNGRDLLGSTDIAERYLGVGADLGATGIARDEYYTTKLRQLMGD